MRIYVAGPLSQGDVMLNVRNALEAADVLLQKGHAPFVPHLTAFWHMIFPQEYETWMKLDFQWLRICDAILRLPGDSEGADREVALAQSLGIPVYYSVDEIQWA